MKALLERILDLPRLLGYGACMAALYLLGGIVVVLTGAAALLAAAAEWLSGREAP